MPPAAHERDPLGRHVPCPRCRLSARRQLTNQDEILQHEDSAAAASLLQLGAESRSELDRGLQQIGTHSAAPATACPSDSQQRCARGNPVTVRTVYDCSLNLSRAHLAPMLHALHHPRIIICIRPLPSNSSASKGATTWTRKVRRAIAIAVAAASPVTITVTVTATNHPNLNCRCFLPASPTPLTPPTPSLPPAPPLRRRSAVAIAVAVAVTAAPPPHPRPSRTAPHPQCTHFGCWDG